MFDKLKVIFDLFRVGGEIENAAAAKNFQNLTNAIGALLLLVVQVASWFHLTLPIDQATAMAIAGGIVAVLNVVLTTISSQKVGLLPAAAGNGAGGGDSSGGQGLPDVPAPAPAPAVAVQPVGDTAGPATNMEYRN